jgi:hypothetical protein
MAEVRLYAKITLDFADCAKIKPLSDKAFRQFIESLLWSRRMLSDGFIPTKMTKILFSEEVFEELTTNDDVNPSLKLVEGGVMIHDFAEHQTTREVVEQKRANGSKGGKAKAANISSENLAPATTLLEQNSSESLAKTETETESETINLVNTYDQTAFNEFWELVPRKVAKATAEKAFIKATRQTSALEIIEGMRRLANDPNLPDTQYIPHPTTWLNAQGWNDDPYPARTRTNAKLANQQSAREAFLNATTNQPAITSEPDWAINE